MQPRLARGMQQAVVRQTAHACEASCPRSRGRQRALATKAISPSSREEVGPGLHTRMQPPLPTRGTSSAGSRGKLPAIAGQAARARHQAAHGTLAGHAQHSRLPRLVRAHRHFPRRWRAGSGHARIGAAAAIPWGPDAAASFRHARNYHGQWISVRLVLKA
ncbi:hypothetical protein AB3S75_042732 [Citrus x aurantiifolia]